MKNEHSHNHYWRFFAMLFLSFVAMYIFMYAMVNTWSNVYHSFNQIYMALLMVAVMAIIEIGLMYSMYPNKKANAAIVVGSAVILLGSWFAIRYQIGISDKQFLRSMISHHASAILMCEQVEIQDHDILDLCSRITTSQQKEIEEMKQKLNALQ